MTYPHSGSDPSGASRAFPRLHPRMQRWVHEKGWTSLHDAQERAIDPILDGACDVIISAATAAGKTEAAFLPILSVLASTRDRADSMTRTDDRAGRDPGAAERSTPAGGVEVLYVSPLKALINDQFDRLDLLCERAGVEVHRWHGDVSAASKRMVLHAPSGVLLITPESLEAVFVNRGTQVSRVFAGIRYVVVDELHSFLSTPRGAQLESLLGRIELSIRRQVPRIGLSATLGDMGAAARALRPQAPGRVLIISSGASGQQLRIQVRGYRWTPVKAEPQARAGDGTAAGTAESEAIVDVSRLAIADHLFSMLRGTDNLVFANARREVEIYADLLARRCDAERVPNEFWPHHGSLAKDVREVVEAQLKDRTRPVTAICTSTLEMGIDIGTVSSVAQIGPPPSVASLRQRLGRSGRRDEPAVLRIYISERELDRGTTPVDDLRCKLVQTIAMVRLLLTQWVEPPDDPGLNLSTLIQQVLSIIAQHGGASASDIHRALCGPGPFERVDTRRFARLLRAMAAAKLVVQATDGTLLHGAVGERIVNHYSFYAAFQTPEEWRLIADGRTLGHLPITQPLAVGGLLIFAGRRWKITGIDGKAHIVELVRAVGGVPPEFGGSGALIGDRVRSEMVLVYSESAVPEWLNRDGQALLREGREAWRRFGLARSPIIPAGAGCIILPWLGDRALITAACVLAVRGVEASVEGPSLCVSDRSAPEVVAMAQDLLACPVPDPVAIARELKNTELDKWDWVLDADLAAEATAARMLDVSGAWRVLELVAGHSKSH